MAKTDSESKPRENQFFERFEREEATIEGKIADWKRQLSNSAPLNAQAKPKKRRGKLSKIIESQTKTET